MITQSIVNIAKSYGGMSPYGTNIGTNVYYTPDHVSINLEDYGLLNRIKDTPYNHSSETYREYAAAFEKEYIPVFEVNSSDFWNTIK